MSDLANSTIWAAVGGSIDWFQAVIGIGTFILLGIQGWILWRQTSIINSQKQLSESQSVYLMRKEDPQIDISKKEYSEDKLVLHMINLGKTKAAGLAIKTEAYLINPDIKKEGDKILVSSRGDWDIKKQFNLKDDGHVYSLEPSISEIFHDKSDYPELELNQGHRFAHEIIFGLYGKGGKYPMPSKWKTFKDLIELLKKNNVLGCEIRISLLYKNLVNQVVEEIQIDKFYILPVNLSPKFLSELKESERFRGGMKYVPIHPFLKQEINLPKSEKAYREINHCER